MTTETTTVTTETKTATAELQGESGEFVIRLATKRRPDGEYVIDADQDIYADNAIGVQDTVVGCPEHGSSCGGPAGWAKTFETDTDIRARGRLDLSTPRGLSEFHSWRAMGASAQFSYVYKVLSSSRGTVGGRPVRRLEAVQVLSVDRVSVGAGVDTGLLSLKSCAGKCPGKCPGAPEEDWRDVVRDVKRQMELRETRPILRAEYERFLELTSDYPTVPEADVPQHLRDGAAEGIKLASAKLGITTAPRIRWYRRNAGAKASRWGYTELGSDGTIHLAVHMPASRVVEVSAHELAHLAGADEEQAREFGLAITQQRNVWADDRNRY